MSLLVAALASTLVGAAHPAAFGSPTTAFTGGPVRVQACEAYATPILGGSSEGIVTSGEIPNLRISFVNNAGVAATQVRFTVRSGGAAESITDSGTFSNGAVIAHDFSPAFAGNDAQCSVDSVAFADGSTWTSSN